MLGGGSQWVTQGTSIYYNTGNVGVGTTAPSSKLEVEGNLAFGPETGKHSFFSDFYSVPTATQTTITLRDGVTSLTNGWNYKIKLVTTGTSIQTGAEYIVNQTASGTWTSKLVSAKDSSSNHPLLGISGTSVYIYHNNASTYTINTFVEGYYTANTTATATEFFGLEGAITSFGGGVGIGTTSPINALTLQSGSQYDGFLMTNGTNNLARIITYGASNDNPSLEMYGGATVKIALNTDSRPSYFNSGDIGIGITNPTNKLHVEGTGGGSAGIYLNSAVPSSTANTLYNSGGSLYWNGASVASQWVTQGTSIYYNTGNVGIGTTDPIQKLDISGGSIRLADSYNIQWGGANNYITGSNASNYLAMVTNNNEALRIDSSGYVGIGTTITQRNLYVAGESSTLNGNLLSKQEGGSYFGRTKISENQWGQNLSSAFGTGWTAKATSRNWNAVAVSSDGRYQTGAVYNGYIYISSDYGDTWSSEMGGSSATYADIAMSSNGKIQVAARRGSTTLLLSTDYGNTWASTGSSGDWNDVAMSSDGKYISAGDWTTNRVFVSTDYGSTWTSKVNIDADTRGLAISSDGKYQTVVGDWSTIYVSSDYGNTWTSKSSSKAWRKVAMSSDGKYQMAGVYAASDYLYISTDYGNTWSNKGGLGARTVLNMTADGKMMVTMSGNIYVSSDFGDTWSNKGARDCTDIAISSDGRVTACAVWGSYIYESYMNSFVVGGGVGIGTTNPGTAKLSIQGGGLVVGAPTGGDKGAGTINATAVYDDNVLLTDYVFDKYFDGSVRESDLPLHSNYNMLSLSQMADYISVNRHLPTIPGRDEWEKNGKFSLGVLANHLWETAETQALYVVELNNEIKQINNSWIVNNGEIEINSLKNRVAELEAREASSEDQEINLNDNTSKEEDENISENLNSNDNLENTNANDNVSNNNSNTNSNENTNDNLNIDQQIDNQISILGIGNIDDAVLGFFKEVWFSVGATFEKAVAFLGEVTFGGVAKFEKPIELSGSSVGQATIKAGETISEEIRFENGYTEEPIITATPTDFLDGTYKTVTEKDPILGLFDKFRIEMEKSQSKDIKFNWHIFGKIKNENENENTNLDFKNEQNSSAEEKEDGSASAIEPIE